MVRAPRQNQTHSTTSSRSDPQSQTTRGSHAPRAKREPVWPLDLSIAALAGLVMYLIVSRLSFTDSRLLFNAGTYALSVPLIAIAMAFLMRGVASRYVQKSIQIGFLFSVSLHLLLLMLATGVIIFSRYYPQSVMGVKPERSPVKRTVPEYLFKTTEKRDAQPDWSKPSEAETASPVAPREQRQLPPVQQSAPQLEMPQPQQPIRKPDRPHLQRRETVAESKPQPSNSPAKLARQRSESVTPSPQASSKPLAPTVPVQAEISLATPQRSLAQATRSLALSALPREMAAKQTPIDQPPETPLAGLRKTAEQMPRVGERGLSLNRPKRQATQPFQAQPAGAAPAPSSVAVAALVETADRMIAPMESTPLQRGKTTGAQLTLGETRSVSDNPADGDQNAGAMTRRNELAAAAGVPDVQAGQAMRQPGKSKLANIGSGFDPAGTPNVEAIAGLADAAAGGSQETTPDDQADQQLDRMAMGTLSRSQAPNAPTSLQPPILSGPSLDLLLDEGAVGFADMPDRVAGVLPSDERPKIASLDLTTGTRPRRDVGGPVTPFGTKVAAVESFSRRVMRTEGGRAPTPAGLVGPATEEAIERGLAYLDSIQNEDGSWSLQGHGTDVVIRGDTAATGLCLLAFQGAGYTHKQHQYADTVGKAIQFLVSNQRTNGDLYRSENALSDRNVAFYSHGISALAMSEAYGMTQDPELKEPAQMALNYIAGTQHRSRGGWRYTPQVSADTSVTGWMMMALKSGQLSGLEVPEQTYDGINRWLSLAQAGPNRQDRYRYNPYAPDTPTQRHGRSPTPTMTAVGMLMRMYSGWRRDTPAMRSAAEYLLTYPPQMGTKTSPQRDGYYWYYATQVMFHMGDEYWEKWNESLNPVLLESQLTEGPYAGSWDPMTPVPDRWSAHAGRLYVTTMNLLNLEVYYRHLPIYEETAE